MYDVVFGAKVDSPLGLIQWLSGASTPPSTSFTIVTNYTTKLQAWMRVYTLTSNNSVQEHCWDGDHWYGGSLASVGFVAAPNSKLTGIQFSSNLRVYYQQSSGVISELQYSGGLTWGQLTLPVSPAPLMGTSLAAISWGDVSIRLYYQDQQCFLREMQYEGGWQAGSLKVPAKPGTPISVVGWTVSSGNPSPSCVYVLTYVQGSIRLYYIDDDCTLQEQCLEDGGQWYTGSLGATGTVAASNSSLDAANWTGVIQIYYQAADNTNAIQEFGTINDKGWSPYETLALS